MNGFKQHIPGFVSVDTPPQAALSLASVLSDVLGAAAPERN